MASHHRHHLTAGHHLLLFLLLVTALYASAQSSNNNNNNQYFPNTNFNPSMAIVIIVLISAFFFLGFFSIYIRQCAGDRLNPRLSSTTTTAATAARSRRQRGLDPELLQTFPTLVYSEVKGLKIGKESLECAVCLSEFEDDETLRLLPKCSHVFHPDCIDAWLAAHVTCPVCRCNLTESDEKTSKNDALTTETSPEQLVELPTTEQQQQEEMTSIQIDQDDESRAEMENLERFVNLKRARSQARPVNFPRSHSTGHSLVQPGQNLDRFTLRLPEDIRKEIVAANLQRTTSCSVAFRREASTRRGYTEGSLGRGGRSIRLGRSDRWGSFLSRTLSLKNWGRRGEPEMGSGSVKAVRFNGVMGPLGGNSSVEGKEDEVSSKAALNNV